MLERYKTILNTGEAELIEKKSRFIATATPVEDEATAKIFIEKMCKKYNDANHNVFAYQIGEKNQIQRYSDDGEPSQTAGMPILDILKGEDIKNTVIVVTRYFGGTLLGKGGLVRAYSKTAKEGLIACGIIEKVMHQIFEICVDYTLAGKVEYEILKYKYIIEDTLYTDKVVFVVLAMLKDRDKFINHITEVTAAQAYIAQKELVYKNFAISH